MENRNIWKQEQNSGTSENKNDDDKQDHLERKKNLIDYWNNPVLSLYVSCL